MVKRRPVESTLCLFVVASCMLLSITLSFADLQNASEWLSVANRLHYTSEAGGPSLNAGSVKPYSTALDCSVWTSTFGMDGEPPSWKKRRSELEYQLRSRVKCEFPQTFMWNRHGVKQVVRDFLYGYALKVVPMARRDLLDEESKAVRTLAKNTVGFLEHNVAWTSVVGCSGADHRFGGHVCSMLQQQASHGTVLKPKEAWSVEALFFDRNGFNSDDLWTVRQELMLMSYRLMQHQIHISDMQLLYDRSTYSLLIFDVSHPSIASNVSAACVWSLKRTDRLRTSHLKKRVDVSFEKRSACYRVARHVAGLVTMAVWTFLYQTNQHVMISAMNCLFAECTLGCTWVHLPQILVRRLRLNHKDVVSWAPDVFKRLTSSIGWHKQLYEYSSRATSSAMQQLRLARDSNIPFSLAVNRTSLHSVASQAQHITGASVSPARIREMSDISRRCGFCAGDKWKERTCLVLSDDHYIGMETALWCIASDHTMQHSTSAWRHLEDSMHANCHSTAYDCLSSKVCSLYASRLRRSLSKQFFTDVEAMFSVDDANTRARAVRYTLMQFSDEIHAAQSSSHMVELY